MRGRLFDGLRRSTRPHLQSNSFASDEEEGGGALFEIDRVSGSYAGNMVPQAVTRNCLQARVETRQR